MSPSPSPSSPADSSAASSPAPSALFIDPGPRFDPGGPEPDADAGPPPGPEPGPDGLFIEWAPERVAILLRAQGELVHTAIAVDKDSGEWRYTDGELGSIAPALTAILNRHDVTRAAAAAGDELALIVGLSGYVMRSWGARRAALERLEDPGPEPVSGFAAPPGTGPTPAEEELRRDPFDFTPPDLDTEPDETPPIRRRTR